MTKFLTAALAALMTIVGLAPMSAAEQVTSVFVVAHQDDELQMGAAIRSHAEAGQRVVVVLATDGSATSARRTISKRLGREVSRAEVTEHRDFEYLWTCKALGATECVIAPPELRMVDGQATAEQADAIFDWVTDTWPGARVKSHSFLSISHNDHYQLGAGLLRAFEQGQITDARFSLSWSERRDLTAAKMPIPNGSTTRRPVGDTEQNAYRLWAPDKAGNRYWAVGYTSATASMNEHRRNPVSYFHPPAPSYK